MPVLAMRKIDSCDVKERTVALTVKPWPVHEARADQGAEGRLPELDVVRVLALGGVVAVHVLAWAGRDVPPAMRWYIELDLLARLLVPSFILLTGVVLGQSAERTRRAPGEFLRKRLLRIALPWLVWTGVWMTVWEFLAPVLSGREIASPPELLEAVASGPGYLYFLLLILQCSIIFPLFPTGRRARFVVAGAAILLQFGLSLARLALNDLPDPLHWLLVVHAYEIGAFWVGYFALGVFLGSDAVRLLRPTRWRVTAAVAVAAVSTGLLMASSYAEWWNYDRLSGANMYLHPLFLPGASAIFVLLYWGAGAAIRLVPRLAEWAVTWAAMSFGVYLVHQYPLEIIGPSMQPREALLRVSDPLPASLPDLAVLYLVTCAMAAAMVALLRRHPWGLLALGENRVPRVSDDAVQE